MARLPESHGTLLGRAFDTFHAEVKGQMGRDGPLSMTSQLIEGLSNLQTRIGDLNSINFGGEHADYQWLSQLVIVADSAERLSDYLSDRQRYRSLVMPQAFDLIPLGYAPLPAGTPLHEVARAISIVAEERALAEITRHQPRQYVEDERQLEDDDDLSFIGDSDPNVLQLRDKGALRRFPSPHREFILLRVAIDMAFDATAYLEKSRNLVDHLNDFIWEAFDERDTPRYPQRLFAIANAAAQIREVRGIKDVLIRTRLKGNPTRAKTLSEAFEVISDLAVKAGAMGEASVSNVASEVLDGDALSASNLSRIIASVPNQQIAPVRFGFENEKLVVVHTPAKPEARDADLVSSVHKSIVKSGERLVSELPGSQCDRRFLAQIRELHEEVRLGVDIVYIGMQSQECQIAAKAFDDEFSPYFVGMLTSYFASLSDYVAQFPDWQRFLEQSASAKILEAELVGDLRDLITNLQRAVAVPEVVDTEVGTKLHWLAGLISEKRPVTKKTVMAVALSLHNLASAIVKWTAGVATQTAEKTQTYLSSAAALALVGSIGAAFWRFIPISNIIARAPWLEQALQWLKEAIPLIK